MLKPLFPNYNVAGLHMANLVNPRRWHASANAPSSLAALKRDAGKRGVIHVSTLHSAATIYGDPEVNVAARAWHDACHLILNAEFNDAGERAVCELQCEQLARVYGAKSAEWFQWITHAEIIGQLNYKNAFGVFPDDQRAFVVEWLEDHHEYAGQPAPTALREARSTLAREFVNA